MTWPGTGAETIEALLADPRLPQSAVAFDADGTLWTGDIGELVLARLVADGFAPKDAVERYFEHARTDMVEACAFCLRIVADLPLAELTGATAAIVAANEHGPLIGPAVELARELHQRGAEVWIISGSNIWSVRLAAEHAGIGHVGMLAVSGKVVDGRLVGHVDLPVPCRGGKVEALRVATKRPLLFAAGNSDYDLDLLDHAEIRLAVGPRDRETMLIQHAQQLGWPTLRV